MTIEVTVLNAFIDTHSSQAGGNPAGVVLSADHLSTSAKQAIALEVGLSETAFVSRSEKADFKLEFFTPTQQIPHCGHATVAAFSWLQQQGLLHGEHSSKETIDGCRDIWLQGERVYMQQQAPVYTTPNIDQALLRTMLNGALWLKEPEIVHTGNAFLLLELADLAALKALQVDQALLLALSNELDLIGLYAFTRETSLAGRDAASRMFAPRYGITEEAATGMAAGPLACLLAKHANEVRQTWWIEQGHVMTPASPSLIEVELALNETGIQSLQAGGIARYQRTIQVSSPV